jgi:uncharacterized protein (DUF885 family)
MGFTEAYDRAPPPEDPALRALADEMVPAFCEMSPVGADSLGIHSYDRFLGDYSLEGLDREERILSQFELRLKTIDQVGLGPSDRMDHAVLVGSVEAALLGLRELAWHRRDPNLYNSVVMAGVLSLARRDYAPVEKRLESLCERLEQVPSLMAAARQHLTDMPRIYLDLARAQFPGSAAFLRTEVPRFFHAVTDTRLLGRMNVALSGVADAYSRMELFLTDAAERQKALGEDPPYALGERNFSAMLRAQEAVTEDPASLLRRGKEELLRLRERLEKAARDLDPALGPEEALRRVGGDHGTAESLIPDAYRTLAELAEFARGLVTVPEAPVPDVVETPPFMRSTTLASIDPPGPFEDVATEAYYQVTLPDPASSPRQVEEHLRALSRSTLKIISAHEVYPGHYVQFLHLRRKGSRMARMGMSTALIEGWAHYTEEMMADAGLAAGRPDIGIGQLLNALLRNVRYLSAIGLHAEGMTVEESHKLFEEKAFADYGTAVQQSLRGTYDPGYLNYTLGKLMIRKLREDWTRGRGGREAWGRFHDQFLSYGYPPIPLVRQQMLGANYDGDMALLPR